LMKKLSAETLSKELYEKSGLLGIAGGDMRTIVEKMKQGEKQATLAFDMYIHRLNASIASMAASLKGMEVIVFTGAIGENTPELRIRVCDDLSFLGLKIRESQGTEDR